jgi:hypothetical protein
MSGEDLLAQVADFYLKSHDYNGIPASSLIMRYGVSKVRDFLAELIREERVSVVFGDFHPNPHIKALPSEPVAEQLEKLGTTQFENACVYPAGRHLGAVPLSRERPFLSFKMLVIPPILTCSRLKGTAPAFEGDGK